MVVEIISSAVQKNRGGILLYCAGADGNTCGRKSRGDEKQLIDLEWPKGDCAKRARIFSYTPLGSQTTPIFGDRSNVESLLESRTVRKAVLS